MNAALIFKSGVEKKITLKKQNKKLTAVILTGK